MISPETIARILLGLFCCALGIAAAWTGAMGGAFSLGFSVCIICFIVGLAIMYGPRK